MTDRERLIELILNVKSDDFRGVSVEQIADYLLENGVIVPPCKVGDTVYTIYRGYAPVCIKWVVLDVSAKFITTYEGLYRYDEIGDRIFLTREEAEKALAERNCEE